MLKRILALFCTLYLTACSIETSVEELSELETSPTVTLSSAEPNYTQNATLQVTATFSEAVEGFDLTDLILVNATASNLAGSGRVYTFDLLATAEGLLSVKIPKNMVVNLKGEQNKTASNIYSNTYDVTPPTVTLSSTANDPINSAVTVTATFSESVTGFSLADLNLVNAVVTGLAGSGSTYTFTLTPSADGVFSAEVTSGSFTDLALNASVAASNIYSNNYDGTVPTAVLSSADASPTNVATVSVTLTFSEDVTGFTLGDLTLVNATAGNLAGSGDTYTFDLTASAAGVFSARLKVLSVVDDAGSFNTATSNLYSNTYDAVSPTVTLSSSAANPTNGAITVTATFSESVTGFTDADISVSNATVSGLAGTGTTYTFTLTPTADGAFTAQVDASTVSDAAGNANTASNVYSNVYDGTVPTVTLSSAASNPTTSATISVTATFSEDVTGFALSDLTLVNATAGNLAGSGDTYTFDLTASAKGTFSAQVAATRVVDSANNSNSVASNVYSNFYNRVPVADDDTVTAPEYVGTSVTLSATDADGDALTYTVVASPSHGTLTGTAPNLTYTPTSNYTGADSFTFRANDGTVNSNTATVSITVTAGSGSLDIAGFNAAGAYKGRYSTDLSVLHNDEFRDIVKDDNGKYLVTGYKYDPVTSDAELIVMRFLSNGTVDTAFATSGAFTLDLTVNSEMGYAIAYDSATDKIFVAGSYNANNVLSGLSPDALIVSLNDDGTLNTGFGGGAGYVIVDFGVGLDLFYDLKVHNSRLVASGYTGVLATGVWYFAVAMLDLSGNLDTNFSGDGKLYLTHHASQLYGVAYNINIASDDDIILSGYYQETNYHVGTARVSWAGVPDATYGTGGVATFDFGAGSYSQSYGAVKSTANDSLYIVGYAQDASGYKDSLIAKIKADGSGLDTSFNTNGYLIADHSGSTTASRKTDILYGVTLDSSGRLIVTGYADKEICGYPTLARYSASGTIDSTFASSGKIDNRANISCGNRYYYSVFDSAVSKIVTVGNTWWGLTGVSAAWDVVIARFFE